MKFETEEIETIAQRVASLLRPVLAGNGEKETEDKLLTPDQIADLLNVKKPQIYAWVQESKYNDDGIPFLKAGKFLRFSQKAVLQWMENHRVR